MIDESSLARTAEAVNEAHFFGHAISRSDAARGIEFLQSRYFRSIPARVRAQTRPDPRWAEVPKNFVLTETDRQAKLRTFTGEPVQNASMRMIHGREAARALLILGAVTGADVPQARELCRGVREAASGLEAEGKHLY